MVQREVGATVAALMLDILKHAHQVWDAAETAAEASDSSHGATKKRDSLAVYELGQREEKGGDGLLLGVATGLLVHSGHLPCVAHRAVDRSRHLLQRG
jgi:hypothetical protein